MVYSASARGGADGALRSTADARSVGPDEFPLEPLNLGLRHDPARPCSRVLLDNQAFLSGRASTVTVARCCDCCFIQEEQQGTGAAAVSNPSHTRKCSSQDKLLRDLVTFEGQKSCCCKNRTGSPVRLNHRRHDIPST